VSCKSPTKKKITLVDWQIPIEAQIGFLGGDVFTPNELQLMFHMNLNNIANFTFVSLLVQKPSHIMLPKVMNYVGNKTREQLKPFPF
jgi:hypothetical protein